MMGQRRSKGGTSLRKFRAGAAGRFSADLDFYAPDDDVTVEVMATLADAHVDRFGFRIGQLDGDGRRADLEVDTPCGSLTVCSSIEVSQRPLILPAEWLSLIELPIHDRYDITVPATPVIAVEEAIADKLARYRRTSLVSDLYDLAWFAQRPLDDATVRRLWVIKVYFDIVEDGRGQPPISPNDVLAPRSPLHSLLKTSGTSLTPSISKDGSTPSAAGTSS